MDNSAFLYILLCIFKDVKTLNEIPKPNKQKDWPPLLNIIHFITRRRWIRKRNDAIASHGEKLVPCYYTRKGRPRNRTVLAAKRRSTLPAQAFHTPPRDLLVWASSLKTIFPAPGKWFRMGAKPRRCWFVCVAESNRVKPESPLDASEPS